MTPLCYKPWDSIFHDEQGRIAPCCEFRPALINHSIHSYLVSSDLQEVKSNLLVGVFPKQCQSCQLRENNGGQSLRLKHQKNRQFEDRIQYIEMSLDNVCNMSCLMCSPDVSQGLAKEQMKLGWVNQIPLYTNYQVLDNLKEIQGDVQIIVTGGEPFMSEKIVPLLELVRDKKWSISISTNCSTINKRALSIIKDIDRVTYQISIDGVDDLYSFVRYPSNWQTFEKTLTAYKKSLKNPTYQSIHFNTVISILNIHQLENIFDYAYSKKTDLWANNIIWPDWLSWSILTPEEKDITVNNLKKIKPKLSAYQKILDSSISHIQSYEFKPDIRNSFIEKINQIIHIRNIKSDLFPWFLELKSQIN